MDRGEGRTKYLLTGEGAGTVFVIDEATGNIHVTKSLDREEKAQYVLLAQAVDRASNRPLEPPSEFIIKVQDINDNPPVFPLGPYHATVPEMSNVGESPALTQPSSILSSAVLQPLLVLPGLCLPHLATPLRVLVSVHLRDLSDPGDGPRCRRPQLREQR